MATSLTQVMSIPAALYFDEKFLQSFEDHLQWFLQQGKFNLVTVDAVSAINHKGDLAGLLRQKNVADIQIYPSIRLSGFRSSHDYDGTTLQLKVVNFDAFTLLAKTWSTHNTSKRKG